LSVTIVYGRLAADNEIMAVKAAGIHVLYVAGPAFVLGTLLSGVTIYLYNYVIPAANYEIRTAVMNNIEDVVYATLRRDGSLRGGG
ncbi:LptF/LptG family permease, partial [Salmonella sp. SAL4447]|uniref:LptF/LptG family permease n=1 Tax=Salmonella sp. SAL4447 TaxID=3159902 RepID=UPI0039785421